MNFLTSADRVQFRTPEMGACVYTRVRAHNEGLIGRPKECHCGLWHVTDRAVSQPHSHEIRGGSSHDHELTGMNRLELASFHARASVCPGILQKCVLALGRFDGIDVATAMSETRWTGSREKQ